MNILYISKLENDIILALKEDNKLVEIIVENEEKRSIVGNIYKAKVVSVSSGLNAAFIDYGEKKKGFLPLINGRAKFETTSDIEDDLEEMEINQNDEILVQVERDEISTKGAKLTSYITIPGNFIVLMPKIKFIGVSKKIKDREFKSNIKSFIRSFIDKDMGIIVRTAAYEAKKSQIKKEYNELYRIWKEINKKSISSQLPSLLYRERKFIIKTLRNLIKNGIDEIFVDSKELYNDLLYYFSFINKNMKKKVHFYQFKMPMFAYYNIDREMDSMFQKNVYLKHGAYIVIETTEALTAIDVNSGKMSKKIDNDELFTNVNIMAAEEIARQLRLRNIGGLIVIDFIDMNNEYSKKLVIKELKKHLKKDRSTTKVLKVSQFGLVEMTRKKAGPSVINYFVSECHVCNGSGYIPKPIYIGLKLIRWIKEHGKNYKNDKLIITASHRIINEIENTLLDYVQIMMNDWNIDIKIELNDNIQDGLCEIYSMNKLEKIATIK